MSSNLSSRDRLALPLSHHVPPLSPTSPCDLVHHQRDNLSSRRGHSAKDRPRRVPIPRSGIMAPVEDTTDIVLLTTYSWSPMPWTSTMQHPSANVRESGVKISEPPMHSQQLMGKRDPKRAIYADVDEWDDRVPAPPGTPQIGRLKTPELRPVKECSQFCHCCPDDKQYQEGRAKMDSQREFITSSSGRHL